MALRAAVEGYPARLSALPGEEVGLHCSCRAATFSVEVARVGAEREVVWRRDGVPGAELPVPADADAEGCGWPETLRLPIGPGWRSGYYEIALRADGVLGPEAESRAFIVVRSANPGRDASIVLVHATATLNAYNDWNGASFYEADGWKVSFQRPVVRGMLWRGGAPDARLCPPGPTDVELDAFGAYCDQNGLSAWSGATGWHSFERRFTVWAERNGYAVDHATSADLEFEPGWLEGYRLMVSVGHDEYWSWGMRDRLDAFLAEGGNAAFLSGNAIFWQVRFEDDGASMVSYRFSAHKADPVLGTARARELTGMWSDPLVGRPENETIGVSFKRGGYARIGRAVEHGSGGYTVWRHDHWAFSGTEIRYGDLLGAAGAVVGYECDGCAMTLVDGLPVPTGEDGTPADRFTILATSPAHLWSNTAAFTDFSARFALPPDAPGDLEFVAARLYGSSDPDVTRRLWAGNAVMGVLEHAGGGTVFTTGCVDWPFGLDGEDPAVEQVTRNVLDRLSS